MRLSTSNVALTVCSLATLGACSPAGRVGDDGFTGSGSATASGTATDGGSGPGSATTASSTSDSVGTDSATDSGADTGNDDGIKFDTPGGASTAGEGGGNCGCGNTDWSYVWIANSGESTVSKINTRTLVEEGRYITRPDKGGNPSRTSVSIDGKAMVIANRYGGITKIWARPEFCPGGNTSTGKGDVKPWGTDDCVDWYTAFPDATTQRPVAWTPGQLNPTNCQYEDQKVWTVVGKNGVPGMCTTGGIWVHRLDGESGAIEDTVHIPDKDFVCDLTGTGNGQFIGPYGGAVDADGNFWFHGFEQNKLVRVDFDTLNYEIFGGGGYGITVDTKGRVWTASSIRRFDYTTKQSASANVSTSGGIAQDLQGRIWAAGQNGVVWVDMETLAVGNNVTLPYSGQVKGVSVDIDGYIWAVFQGDTHAYKIHPDTYAIESYNGLNDPYTYSDMTGGQINNVECNPPEG